jgi:hypothetical protein
MKITTKSQLKTAFKTFDKLIAEMGYDKEKNNWQKPSKPTKKSISHSPHPFNELLL